MLQKSCCACSWVMIFLLRRLPLKSEMTMDRSRMYFSSVSMSYLMLYLRLSNFLASLCILALVCSPLHQAWMVTTAVSSFSVFI